MALELEQRPAETVPPARRRRRWPRFVLLVVVLTLLAVMIGGDIYLHHYAPLSVGSEASSGQYADPHLKDLDGDMIAYSYHEGGVILRGLWIENNGPIGVTVTGVQTSFSQWAGLLSVIPPRLGDERFPTDLAHSTPFHAFSLAPQQGRLVDVLFQMGHCSSHVGQGESESMNSVTFDFKALGVHRSQDMPLATGVWISSPKTCPSG